MNTQANLKIFVRRSCRIAQCQQLGTFREEITVRDRMFNPMTGRMIYVDGITGQSILNTQPIKEELNYFEMMLEKLKNEPPTEPITQSRGSIYIRRSARLMEKKQQRDDEGLAKTTKIRRRRNNIHLGDTIRMMTATIKL